jgi:predicted metal-dependent hydrolase
VCRHRRKRGVKNLYLRIQNDGSVDITTPWHFSKKSAEAFVVQKEKWISERLAHKTRHGRHNPKHYDHNCRIWFLGKAYPVRCEKAAGNRIDFKDDHFLFKASDPAKFSEALERFYLRSAKEILSARTAFWSQKMGLTPKAVKFRRYKSRWGCCSADNVITLNTALLRYEMRLIDYVIIHELAHIRHKHHQKAFWELVAKFEPEWKILRKRLV